MTKHLDISDVLDECLDRMAWRAPRGTRKLGESIESCAEAAGAPDPERRAELVPLLKTAATMASSESVPGDTLYWVKRTKESISLMIPQSDMSRAERH